MAQIKSASLKEILDRLEKIQTLCKEINIHTLEFPGLIFDLEENLTSFEKTQIERLRKDSGNLLNRTQRLRSKMSKTNKELGNMEVTITPPASYSGSGSPQIAVPSVLKSPKTP